MMSADTSVTERLSVDLSTVHACMAYMDPPMMKVSVMSSFFTHVRLLVEGAQVVHYLDVENIDAPRKEHTNLSFLWSGQGILDFSISVFRR